MIDSLQCTNAHEIFFDDKKNNHTSAAPRLFLTCWIWLGCALSSEYGSGVFYVHSLRPAAPGVTHECMSKC